MLNDDARQRVVHSLELIRSHTVRAAWETVRDHRMNSLRKLVSGDTKVLSGTELELAVSNLILTYETAIKATKHCAQLDALCEALAGDCISLVNVRMLREAHIMRDLFILYAFWAKRFAPSNDSVHNYVADRDVVRRLTEAVNRAENNLKYYYGYQSDRAIRVDVLKRERKNVSPTP
ncbi:hypothetical protein [Microcystis phage Mvi-JY20]|uniref:Uncharacterized protein n=1 Tax=Microcystis phage Mvi-JY20 TaxID=3128146 RepID=A0AAX4QGY8_9CAUD